MPPDAGWPLAIAMWIEVAVAVGDRDCAGELHRRCEPIDGLHVATGGIGCGPAARLLALLELLLDRPADADRHFAEATEQSRSLGSPVWTVRCGLDWAASLAERGEHDRARERFDGAVAAMSGLSLTRLEQQAQFVGARLGREAGGAPAS
jgi:hypothetical protein